MQARDAYRWMREHQPVFRDCNSLAAAATYRAVIDAERRPELFPPIQLSRPR
jgi:cytochrome P450 family 142 subfamily A polypeptide 1